jgi:hypothetical protein
MESVSNPDIVSFLLEANRRVGGELSLDGLVPGDRLLVKTLNTTYHLLITGPVQAILSADRGDRPSGRVQIQGGVFGGSKVIKPGHLFCGGSLEFVSLGSDSTYVTSPIEAIQLVRVAK